MVSHQPLITRVSIALTACCYHSHKVTTQSTCCRNPGASAAAPVLTLALPLSSSSAHWQHLTAIYAFTSTTMATEGFLGQRDKKAWLKDRWPYNILFLHRCIIYLCKKSKGRLCSKRKKSSPGTQGQDLSVVQLTLTPVTPLSS